MSKRLLASLLILAACTPEGNPSATPVESNQARDAATPDEPAGRMVTETITSADPKPGELKTFRDWIVGCDNGGTCKMASLGPDGGDFPRVTMSVARAAGAGGGWRVVLDGDPMPNSVAIDGRRVASGGHDYSGAQAAAIVAAMVNGTSLVTASPNATISLSGASAAIRYIDAQQGRAGGVTAAVAKGPRDAASVPAAPALPLVTAVRPSGNAATPTQVQLGEMRREAECDQQGYASTSEPESHAVGDGATLVLVPCMQGAYNSSYAVFVLRDGKTARVQADVPTGFTDDERDRRAVVVNGDFADGLLTGYAKGRGLGDCGISSTFAWDGTRLRLVEQAEMNECRGNTDLITTWRSRVSRR